MEYQAHEIILPHTIFDHFGKIIQVHVAGVAVVAHAYDAYLRLL